MIVAKTVITHLHPKADKVEALLDAMRKIRAITTFVDAHRKTSIAEAQIKEIVEAALDEFNRR